MTAVLEVSNIKKSFCGITAVDGVSFDVKEGEILGLIGPNGCGKSTLFNCILGQLTPSGGEVKVDGKTVTGLRPSELNRLGVSRTFQLLQVFPKLSVREHLIHDCEISFKSQDGGLVPVALNCTPRYDVRGRQAGMVLVGRPVGE